MALDNSEQIADWNGPTGARWAALRRETEGIVAAFGDAALDRAAAQPGERVIDIGCGCGDTTLALARQVGPSGRVWGLDVSAPMLDVARAQAAATGWAHLAFEEGDAAVAELPTQVDLLFSRFGVMFFAEPVAALRHLRTALRPGGRCVFVCWRNPRDNPWAMVPLAAARQAVGVTPEAADPQAPGPFAFADEHRLRGLLTQAGFKSIRIERFDAPVTLGASARSAAENAVRIGPTSRFAREAGDAQLPAITAAVQSALAPFATADGKVSLSGSTWLVQARSQAAAD